MKFEDRISEYPGRIKLTEENGEAHYYTLERADEPTQPGTPLSAENLNKLTQDVNGKTGASIVLTGDDIAISADDDTTVKERVDSVQSAASEAQSTADTAVSKANAAQSTATNRENLAQLANNRNALNLKYFNTGPSTSLKIYDTSFLEKMYVLVLYSAGADNISGEEASINFVITSSDGKKIRHSYINKNFIQSVVVSDTYLDINFYPTYVKGYLIYR